jgi:hypothetical protein
MHACPCRSSRLPACLPVLVVAQVLDIEDDDFDNDDVDEFGVIQVRGCGSLYCGAVALSARPTGPEPRRAAPTHKLTNQPTSVHLGAHAQAVSVNTKKSWGDTKQCVVANGVGSDLFTRTGSVATLGYIDNSSYRTGTFDSLANTATFAADALSPETVISYDKDDGNIEVGEA